MFTTWLLGERTVVVGSLDLVRKLFASEHELVEGASMVDSVQGCSKALAML